MMNGFGSALANMVRNICAKLEVAEIFLSTPSVHVIVKRHRNQTDKIKSLLARDYKSLEALETSLYYLLYITTFLLSSKLCVSFENCSLLYRNTMLVLLLALIGTCAALCPDGYLQISRTDCYTVSSSIFPEQNVWKVFLDKSFQIYFTNQTTFVAAEADCVLDGGHLASLHSYDVWCCYLNI